MEYDPAEVQRIARELVQRATLYPVWYLVLGALIGAVLTSSFLPLAIGAGLGAVLGYFAGTRRALSLQLEAQLALCQVQIEAHAREALRAQPQLSPESEI